MRRALALTFAFALTLASPPCPAATIGPNLGVTVYSVRASWLAAIGPVTAEGFDALPGGTDLGAQFTRDGVRYTSGGTQPHFLVGPGAGTFASPTSGTNLLATATPAPISLDFNGNYAFALGLELIAPAGAGPANPAGWQLRVTDAGGHVNGTAGTFLDAAPQFVGLVQPYGIVRVDYIVGPTPPYSGAAVAFDDIEHTAVMPINTAPIPAPEPASWMLLGLGLAGVAIGVRRRHG